MKQILVVEDDKYYRNSIALILKMEGFGVETAQDGSKALELLQNGKKTDLVLCDIMMPEMDGHAFLEKLQLDKDYSHTPVVFITALDNRDDMRRSMSAGADDYLTKPFSAKELLDCVAGRLARADRINHGNKLPYDSQELELLKTLTKREMEILLLVGKGETSLRIARQLGIRLNTVEVHRSNLLRKLDAPNSAYLGRWARLAESTWEAG